MKKTLLILSIPLLCCMCPHGAQAGKVIITKSVPAEDLVKPACDPALVSDALDAYENALQEKAATLSERTRLCLLSSRRYGGSFMGINGAGTYGGAFYGP